MSRSWSEHDIHIGVLLAIMADRAAKLTLFRESLGGGVDEEVAAQLLEAHGWDLQNALNTMLGGGDVPAAPTYPAGEFGALEPRSPMRTGYTDTLMAPMTFQEEQQSEAERREREREEAQRVEERRIAQELAHRQELERQAAEQRREAERQALERRRRQQDAEEEARRAATASRAAPGPPAATTAQTPATVASDPLQRVATAPAVVSAPAALSVEPSASPGDLAAPLTRAAADPVAPMAKAAKEADAVAQALMALRRRYKDTDPAGLARCIQTLKVYISNLANAPHDPKFQRINCENAAFQQRVAAYEGSIAVLEACGFTTEEKILAVGPEFLKSKGPKLFDALNKINVVLDQLH